MRNLTPVPILTALLSAASLFAQAPFTTPPTAILTTLTVKPDVDRQELMKVMPAEVRATLRLYLDGKIQQWYSRSDGKGVIFILNCTAVADAKAITDTLPLARNNFATFEYTGIAPLMPLRMLLADPAAQPAPATKP